MSALSVVCGGGGDSGGGHGGGGRDRVRVDKCRGNNRGDYPRADFITFVGDGWVECVFAWGVTAVGPADHRRGEHGPTAALLAAAAGGLRCGAFVRPTHGTSTRT